MDRLRATFIAGPATGLTAQETFTDRGSEFDAFTNAAARMVERSGGDGLNLGEGRRNVIVFYGMGGIGKSALSKQLERHFLSGGAMAVPVERRAVVRADFGESGEFDIETILLRIRTGLGQIRRKWTAFDLAFSLMWERNHPGEALPDFIRRSSAVRHYTERVDLGEQIQNTFVEVLSEIGLSWAPSRIAARIASLTHERLSRSVSYRRMIRECPFFEPIVTADDSSEVLAYLASLLAWQLDAEARREPALLVVFLDTFEAISDRADRELERQVQRIVFLLPQVLFVITTRNRLDWAELSSTSELDYVGVARWPQLHRRNSEMEPRQHLVGALSGTDCDDYLHNVLRNEDGSPTLDANLRAAIIRGSAGLPLYLDLSVTQYLELTATGRAVDVSDFGGPFSSIVVRIMRNLSREQRDILRGVSLLDAFDVDLARAVSNGSDATITRFINSSLVVGTVGLSWPYALHAQLRRAIQDTDHELRDAWSPREWRTAAESVLNRLGSVSATAQAERDRARVAACFGQAARLVLRYGHLPGWILDAAQFLADVGSWQALNVRPTDNGEPSAAGLSLLSGMRGILLRRSGSLDESVTQFDTALSSTGLDDRVRDLLTLHRTHSVRNSGQYRQAQRAYEQLVADGGPYADRAKLQLADIWLLRGEFSQALRELSDLPDEPDLLGESLRIKGHVSRFNCALDEAELIYRWTLDLGKEIGSAALEGKALTNLAETLCWSRPQEAHRLASEAIEFNGAIGNQLEVLKAYAAMAVAAGGQALRQRERPEPAGHREANGGRPR